MIIISTSKTIKTMKNIILFLLFSIAGFSQNMLNNEVVTAEVGVVIPIGALANKFDYAHSYGFWFKIAKEKNFFGSNRLWRCKVKSVELFLQKYVALFAGIGVVG